ncbi:ribonuclease inhibitor-like [Pseudorasbora parva]|uniref:ribonuclease inhibitor-like n=1 Tax=Pseudorasbora parva TaxID=51549 RepID=UPI00351E660C
MEMFLGSHHFLFIMKHTPPPLVLPASAVLSIRKTEKFSDGVTAVLMSCGVTDEGCAALASALRSNPSHLRHLELSWNNLGDSGVKLLSAGLENPLCKLEELWLSECGVTDEGCAALASALRSNPSHLRDLNLSENNLGDSGVKLLSDLKLETLWIHDQRRV